MEGRNGVEWKRKKRRVWYGKKKQSGVHSLPLPYYLDCRTYGTKHTSTVVLG